YRGFFVDGSHRRLNPAKKDVFVTYDQTYGVGYATDLERLEMRVHQIRGLSSGQFALEHDVIGVVNYRYVNFAPGGSNIPGVTSGVFTPQKAIRPSIVTDYQPGYFGFTKPLELAPKVPVDVTTMEIWVNSIMALADSQDYQRFPDVDSPYTPEEATNEVLRTYAHEIGHGIAMCHPGQCYGIDDSTR